MKYKVGDKVRVRKDLIAGKEYGGLMFHPNMANLMGKVVTIKSIYEEDSTYSVKENNYWFLDEMLEPAVKTWDNLQEGDVLVDSDNDLKQVVLGVCGQMVAISDSKTDPVFDEWCTKQELKDNDWEIVQDDKDEVEEFSMEDVAKALNKDVSKIRIKKD